MGVEGLTAQVTQSEPLTSQGSILGTLQYMAPEQLEGRNVDARSDVFAFGAVVYEMVTGRKAFEGTSQASLIGAILHTVPPLSGRGGSGAKPRLDLETHPDSVSPLIQAPSRSIVASPSDGDTRPREPVSGRFARIWSGA